MREYHVFLCVLQELLKWTRRLFFWSTWIRRRGNKIESWWKFRVETENRLETPYRIDLCVRMASLVEVFFFSLFL